MNLMLKDEDRVLYEKCQAAEKAFCEDWKTLVDIDSPTGYTEGIIRVGSIIISKLRSIGAQVDTYPAGANSDEAHVCGTLTGRGKGSILLQAHMDTVRIL
jgi:glutamate carboxypeptidase